MNIGMTDTQRNNIAKGLSRLLADSYILYIKTHNFHWNVTGHLFSSLHTLFETQYTELALAVDQIAERIRALGIYAPGSYKQFSELTVIEEETGIPKAEEMIQQLVQGQEIVTQTAYSIFNIVHEANDEATADLLTQRIHIHEKNAWMLRSLLENS